MAKWLGACLEIRRPGFKTRSDHSLSPWFNFPAALVKSQLVCLRPVGILKVVVLVILFRRFIVFHEVCIVV